MARGKPLAMATLQSITGHFREFPTRKVLRICFKNGIIMMKVS
jgi:hypothetical protein